MQRSRAQGGDGLGEAETQRLRARDPAALDRFFRSYFDRVYALLFRLAGDRTTAQDLTQDTFLKIHRALDRLESGRDPWPWIVTTAVNCCRDHWRSVPTRLGALSGPFEREVVDTGSDPEGTLLSRELAARVQEALQEIPEPARIVVLLRDWQGLGHEEIAQITGSSHAAVRQQYRRALSRLAELLKAVKP